MAQLKYPVDANDQVHGPANAAVTLVEYGDYECPHCGGAHVWLKQVLKQMGHRLRFVFRNFPMSGAHPHALNAAAAAEAAGRQGKFWEMHDEIYEHQAALELDDLLNYARKLGLDTQKFTRDFDDEAILAKVKHDFNGGVRSGVNGTPCFYINGVQYEGEYSAAALVRALKSELETR